MSRYRKEGKQEAYNEMLGIVSGWSDERIAQRFPFSHAELGARIFRNHGIGARDFEDVAAKAIRVERGRRLGKSQMTKLSIDLSTADLEKLDVLRSEYGYTTKVGVIRDLIRDKYKRLC